jgi:CheY-like chemotaxis protein
MPLANNRVLVVEDDDLAGAIVAKMVTDAGGHVIGPFRSNIEALEQLGESAGIEVALLDVNLIGETSYPLASALLATRIPYIFVTGIDRTDIENEHRAAAYLQKPFSQARLVDEILRCGVSSAK